MTADEVAGLILGVALLDYVLVALVFPEKF